MSQIHEPMIPMTDMIVPIPQCRNIPITKESIPFSSVALFTDPLDLNEWNYVEEEYFISGTSHVYAMGQTTEIPLYIKASDVPYVNRILVRKPRDPKAFSGNVLVEICNNAFFMDNPEAGWGAMYDDLMDSGDVWVGLTFRDSCIRSCKRFDPERYAELSIPNPIPAEKRGETGRAYFGIVVDPDMENGLCFDYMSQVAQLLRSGVPGSPLEGYAVRYLYATGASAGDLTTYAGYVHNYAKQENGKPVFDGIQIYMTGAPANLNIEEMNVLAPDPRAIIYPNCPTFRVLTMGDMLGLGGHPDWSVMQRRPESDDPLYRIYEIGGGGIGIRCLKSFMTKKEIAEKVGARFVDKHPKLPYHAFATQYAIRACYNNLKKYCEFGILPPPSQYITIQGEYPDMSFVLDEHGNGCGGIRSHFIDVPIATYAWNGKITPFSKEKLRQLYGNHAQYVKLVAENVAKHVKEGFLLPKDALEIIEAALRFNIDDDEFLDAVIGGSAENTYGM